MIGFRIFENEPIEPKLKDAADEGIPILIDPGRKGEHFGSAPRIDFLVVPEIAAIEGILADVGIDFDPALVRMANDFRIEFAGDVLMGETAEFFFLGFWVEPPGVEIERFLFIAGKAKWPITIHANRPAIALVEHRP